MIKHMTIEMLRAEWAYITGAFITLLFIIDPFAIIPVYLAVSGHFSPAGRQHVRRKATAVALSLLIAMALLGTKIFEMFGITMPAFQIAGGLLLLLIGVAQLNDSRTNLPAAGAEEAKARDDISVFPLATPLLAGPGAISTVILLATKASTWWRLLGLLAAITACILVTYAALGAAARVERLLGRTGMNLLSRVMGIVLTAVAVQFILNGLQEIVPTLTRHR